MKIHEKHEIFISFEHKEGSEALDLVSVFKKDEYKITSRHIPESEKYGKGYFNLIKEKIT